MEYSQREKSMAVGTGAVVLLVVLYMVGQWFVAKRGEFVTEYESLKKTQDKNHDVLVLNQDAGRRWTQMRGAGLTKDASAADKTLLYAIQTASASTDLRLESTQQDRDSFTSGINELRYQVQGKGSMLAITQFLLRLENAQVPLRIRDLKIVGRAEGSGELTLDLQVSTLWEETKADQAPPANPESGKDQL